MDELDRILGESEGLESSSGFTRRVMEAVEQDRSAPPPIAFPWLRLLPAGLAAVGIVVAFASSIGASPAPPVSELALARWLDDPLAVPLGWAALSLLGTWVTLRVSMRFAGR